MVDIEDDMLTSMQSADFDGFVKVGIEYADAVIKAEESYSESLNKLFTEFEQDKKIDSIEADENLSDSYYNLYNELVGVN
jgi:starch synthase